MSRCACSQPARRRRLGGFTLIELMVVVAALGILVSLALPSMQNFVRRAARADAHAVLQEAAQHMERIYSECNAYTMRDASTATPCTTALTTTTALPTTLTRAPKTGTQRYTISLTTLTANTYTLDAVPVQADGCGTFRISSNGVRTLVSNTLPVNECWRR